MRSIAPASTAPFSSFLHRFPSPIVIALFVFAFADRCLGHGDLHDRIVRLDAQIRQFPTRADLVFARGELHCAHADWEKALADYAEARRLEPQMKGLDAATGNAFLAAGKLADAKLALDRALAREPGDAAARLGRARTSYKAGDLASSISDFNRALNDLKRPEPEILLERAEVQVVAGDRAGAVRDLEAALQKVGPLLVIQLYLVDLLLKEQRYDDAVLRLDTIIGQTPRKETWQAQKGDVLLAAKNFGAATEAYSEALKSLSSLPAYRRKTKAMQDLHAGILLGLEKAQRRGVAR